MLNKYKRYWWLFALSLILCMGLAAFYLTFKKPVYLVVGKVLVTDEKSGSTGSAILKSMSLGLGGGSKVDDEVIVMGSQEICGEMINRLKINRRYTEKLGFLRKKDHYGDSPLEIDAPDALFDTLSIAMSFRVNVDKNGKADVKIKKGFFKTMVEKKGLTLPANINTPYGMFTLRTTDHYVPGKPLKMRIHVSGNVPMAEELMEVMAVKIINKKANGIYLDVPETNIQRGKDIINTMMEIYNERGQREKDEAAVNTAKFIDERLGLIYTELTKSEADIEAYKRAHNIVDPEVQVKEAVAKQTAAEQAAVELETNYRIAGMVRDFIDNPENKHSLIPFQASGNSNNADEKATADAIKAYNELVMQRMKLANSARESSQVMQMLDEQIAHTRANVRKSVTGTMDALRVQIAAANRLQGGARSQMSGVPTAERDMRNLYREQGIQNALYTLLLQKREENALVLAANTPKGKIVDHAYAHSKPVAPNKMVTLFVALIASIVLPILFLYLKNLFTTKFTTQAELESLTTLPVIGEVCHNRHHKNLVVQEGKTSSIVELFRLIRNNLQFMLPDINDKVVLVTSSMSGEGKSFVATNVAASFALLGKRVALVGLDIRSPKQADMLELRAVPGVTSYLSQNGVTIDDIVQPLNEVKGLDVYVGGAIPPNPSELLLTPHVRKFIDELRERYDVVIIDSAPIGMVSDTFSLANYASATLYVTRANYTKRTMVRFLNSVVNRGQLKNVALVLNDTNPRVSMGYGYGYGSNED